MGKLKHTKHELKLQRDALQRYQRYLPTLLLKKRQLQTEVRRLEAEIAENKAAELRIHRDLAPWIRLFAEPLDFGRWLGVARVERADGNVAGISVPVLRDVVFRRATPDLHTTPAWLDDGLRTLEELTRLHLARRLLQEAWQLLSDELRTTSQRVNLFEKVKMPECADNIRVIRIFLGDLDTAGVARAKIAKAKAG